MSTGLANSDDISIQIGEFENFVESYVSGVDVILKKKGRESSYEEFCGVENVVKKFKALGNEDYRLGRYESAKSLYACAIDTARDLAKGCSELGAYLKFLKEIGQDGLIETLALCHQNLGLCHIKLQKYEVALKNFQEALACNGKLEKPLFHIPLLYYTLGDCKLALQHFQLTPPRNLESEAVYAGCIAQANAKDADAEQRRKLCNDGSVTLLEQLIIELFCSLGDSDCPSYSVLKKLLSEHADGNAAFRLAGGFKAITEHIRALDETRPIDVKGAERLFEIAFLAAQCQENARLLFPILGLLCRLSRCSERCGKLVLKITTAVLKLCAEHENVAAFVRAHCVLVTHAYSKPWSWTLPETLQPRSADVKALLIQLLYSQRQCEIDCGVSVAGALCISLTQIFDALFLNLETLVPGDDKTVQDTVKLLVKLGQTSGESDWTKYAGPHATALCRILGLQFIEDHSSESDATMLLSLLAAYPKLQVFDSGFPVKSVASRAQRLLRDASCPQSLSYTSVQLLSILRTRYASSFASLQVFADDAFASGLLQSYTNLIAQSLRDRRSVDSLLGAHFVTLLSLLEPNAAYSSAQAQTKFTASLTTLSRDLFLKIYNDSSLDSSSNSFVANLVFLLGEAARSSKAAEILVDSADFLRCATNALRSSKSVHVTRNLSILFGRFGGHPKATEFMRSEHVFETLHQFTSMQRL